MAKITFITRAKETIILEGTSGSIMQLAVDNNVPGIDGDCGGVCSCATCHVHVAAADVDKTGTAEEIETDMLELNDYANEYSRLCCQIEINKNMDGVVLQVAESD